MHLSIGQAADVIGVTVGTLRRWECSGKFLPCFRTCGGHRRYSLSRIHEEIFKVSDPSNHLVKEKTVGYARVSSHDQKLDLKRQEKRLRNYCDKHDWEYEIISDLGSGLNFKKRGLNKLLQLICLKQINRLVLTHQDRLLRFGSPLLFKVCEYFDVEVIILEKIKEEDFEKALVSDVIEIMTVFTAKMYGRRSHMNKKACING